MTTETAPQKPEATPATPPKKSRLEIARQKAEQANALLQKLEAQAKTKQAGQERKLDTRRKVLLGAYLMTRIKGDDELKGQVLAGLDKYLWRDAERALFSLPPLPSPAATAGEVLQGQAPAAAADAVDTAPTPQTGV